MGSEGHGYPGLSGNGPPSCNLTFLHPDKTPKSALLALAIGDYLGMAPHPATGRRSNTTQGSRPGADT